MVLAMEEGVEGDRRESITLKGRREGKEAGSRNMGYEAGAQALSLSRPGEEEGKDGAGSGAAGGSSGRRQRTGPGAEAWRRPI